MAYMVSLVGNHLVHKYSNTVDTEEVSRQLRLFGLKANEPTVQGIWYAVLDSYGARSDSRWLPDGREFDRKELRDQGTETRYQQASLVELESLLLTVYEVLEKVGRRCWIIFDRLDEAFSSDRELEQSALRGLLSAHLDVCSFGRKLKPKLFLRLDVLDRITLSGGFVNASHLRSIRILWDSDSILHMVALRIGSLDQRKLLRSQAALRNIVRAIFPDKVDRIEALIWLLIVTADASREYNPRNVLYLLRASRLEQLQISERRPASTGQMLSHEALFAGYKQLSVARLQDTLYAESSESRRYIEKLRGRKAVFNTVELLQTLDIQPSQLELVVKELNYVGILRRDGNKNRFLIPPLYRPAMFNAVHGGELTVGLSEVSGIAMGMSPDDDLSTSSADNQAELGSMPGPTLTPEPQAVDAGGHPQGRRRVRNRTRRQSRGRDDLVPTGQSSEVQHDQDLIVQLSATLALSEPPSSSSSVRHDTKDHAESKIDVARLAAHQAMALAEEGNFVSAFNYLHPTYTKHVGIACIAADFAYSSRETTLMRRARAALAQLDHLVSSAAMGRQVVLSLELDTSDHRLKEIVNGIKQSDLYSAIIGLIKMVSQAPGSELNFWGQNLPRIASLGSRPGANLKRFWPLLAASRVLSIYRFLRTTSTATAPSLRRLVDEIFPLDQWSIAVPRLEGYLYRYSAAYNSAEPPLLSYQIVSLAAVLEAKGRLSSSLREGVTKALGAQLSTINADHLARFRDWSDYTNLAAEALANAILPEDVDHDGIHEERRGKTTLTTRIHAHQIRTAIASRGTSSFREMDPELQSRAADGVDPKVLEAIRKAVFASDDPISASAAANAALAVNEAVAKSWSGSQRFAQFVQDFLPELRFVSTPKPGYVFDPSKHSLSDLPQTLG